METLRKTEETASSSSDVPPPISHSLHVPLRRVSTDQNVEDSEPLFIPGIRLRLTKFLRNVGEALKFKWLASKDKEQRKDILEDLMPSFACAAVKSNNIISLQSILSKTSTDQGDYSGRTPLHIAASTGNVDMLKYLLYQNAEHTTHDHFGYTPMRDAIKFRKFDVINILKVKKAKTGMHPTKIGIALCL